MRNSVCRSRESCPLRSPPIRAPFSRDAYPANRAGPAVNGYPFAQTGAFTTAVTSGCPTVGTTVSIPRHYYTVDSVQFCDKADNTPDGQWRGFGTGLGCQAKNDLTAHKFVKYGPFHRWDLIAATAFPSGKPFLLGAAGALTNNPGNSESINYANWYAKYATRLNAAKTTSANSFANLTTANAAGDYRVGFQNLGEEKSPYGGSTPLIWVDVADWTLAQRTAWYTALFGIKVATFKTPTIDAMIRIGTFVEFGPRRRASMRASCRSRGQRRSVPDRSENQQSDQLHEQLSHPVHRRHHQPGVPAACDRRQGRLGFVAPAVAAPGRGGSACRPAALVVPTLKTGPAGKPPYVKGPPP